MEIRNSSKATLVSALFIRLSYMHLSARSFPIYTSSKSTFSKSLSASSGLDSARSANCERFLTTPTELSCEPASTLNVYGMLHSPPLLTILKTPSMESPLTASSQLTIY